MFKFCSVNENKTLRGLSTNKKMLYKGITLSHKHDKTVFLLTKTCLFALLIYYQPSFCTVFHAGFFACPDRCGFSGQGCFHFEAA